jgi:hypothetical protein
VILSWLIRIFFECLMRYRYVDAYFVGLRQICSISEHGNSIARTAAVIGLQPPPPVLVSSRPFCGLVGPVLEAVDPYPGSTRSFHRLCYSEKSQCEARATKSNWTLDFFFGLSNSPGMRIFSRFLGPEPLLGLPNEQIPLDFFFLPCMIRSICNTGTVTGT